MLQLRSNYDLSVALDSNYTTVDRNLVFGNNNRPANIPYIQSIGIADAMLPLAYNSIGIQQMTVIINTDTELGIENLQAILASANDACELYDDNKLGLFTIYTNDVDSVANRIDSDFYTSVSDSVQALYNKMFNQVQLREVIERDLHIKVFISRVKHNLIIIKDYQDYRQASDAFLTIGLVPVLFPDFKDRFNADEINYFKALVNRSQIKRINNSAIVPDFQRAWSGSKYQDKLLEVKFNRTLTRMVDASIDNARRQVNMAQENAQTALCNYDAALNKYYAGQKILSNLEEHRDERLNEYKLALKTEGVIPGETSGSYMYFDVLSKLQFFESDEAELVINNLTRSYDYDRKTIRLLKELFIEQKYQMRVIARFNYNITDNDRNNENLTGTINTNALLTHKALFNPHLNYYNCLGDYKPQLIKANREGDMLMFVNIALASTRSINFKDGAVTSRFFRDINEWIYSHSSLTDIPCLIDEEGNEHTIYEVVSSYQFEEDDTAEELELHDSVDDEEVPF